MEGQRPDVQDRLARGRPAPLAHPNLEVRRRWDGYFPVCRPCRAAGKEKKEKKGAGQCPWLHAIETILKIEDFGGHDFLVNYS
jgi:hypothetical protein